VSRAKRNGVRSRGGAAVAALAIFVGALRCSSGPQQTSGSPADGCVNAPTITGDLVPVWSLALGQGVAGGLQVDASGGTVIAGTLLDELRVGGAVFPGAGDGFVRPFVLSLDPDGGVRWERTFATVWVPADVALDGQGNIVLVGFRFQFAEAADLGAGPVGGPIVIAKLDPTGNTIWSRGLDETFDPSAGSSSSFPFRLAVDAAGEIALAGTCYSGNTQASFVARVDPAGTTRWVRAASADVEPQGVILGADGGVIVGGNFSSTLDLGGMPLATTVGAAFISKLDATGTLVWSRSLGDYTTADAIAPDASRALFAGRFGGPLALEGAVTSAQGPSDILLAAVDDATSTASRLATYAAGLSQSIGALASDGRGGLFALGAAFDFVDFGAGIVTPPAGVLLHVDGGGSTIASAAFATSGTTFSDRAVAGDGNGGVYALGSFTGNIDLGSGVLSGPDKYQAITFLAKYALRAPAGASAPRCPIPPAGSLPAASDPLFPQRARLGGNTVALATSGDIATMPVSGAPPKLRAFTQKGVADIAVRAGIVYWANAGSGGPAMLGPGHDGTIVSMPLSGGAPLVLAEGQAGPSALAVDDLNVYWTTAGDITSSGGATATGGVFAVPLAGGTPVPLVPDLVLPGPVVALDGIVVFATNVGSGSEIRRVSRDGGAATLIASTDRLVAALALDTASVYWADADSPTIDASDDDGRIRSAPLAGGTIVPLADAQPGPERLVVLDGELYWANGGGFDNAGPHQNAGIWRMSITGGSVTPIASGLSTVGTFDADDTHLLWTAIGKPDLPLEMVIRAR
jgi:hypothetical protein